MWPRGVMVSKLACDLRGCEFNFPAEPLSGNDLGQVVHTHVPLSLSSKFGTSRGAAMFCDWEGNRRSDVALACVRDLSSLSTYGLNQSINQKNFIVA